MTISTWSNLETMETYQKFFKGLAINEIFIGHSVLDLGNEEKEIIDNLTQSLKIQVSEYLENVNFEEIAIKLLNKEKGKA